MRRAILTLTFVALAVVLTLTPAMAKELVNTDGSQLALHGYDPIAFHVDGKPMAGEESITFQHRGAIYRFASRANRETFEGDPDRYAPGFGGFCAYGASLGSLFPVEIETWQIIDGRLVLNKNLDVKKKFDRDRRGNLAKADAKWPGLVENQGE